MDTLDVKGGRWQWKPLMTVGYTRYNREGRWQRMEVITVGYTRYNRK